MQPNLCRFLCGVREGSFEKTTNQTDCMGCAVNACLRVDSTWHTRRYIFSRVFGSPVRRAVYRRLFRAGCTSSGIHSPGHRHGKIAHQGSCKSGTGRLPYGDLLCSTGQQHSAAGVCQRLLRARQHRRQGVCPPAAGPRTVGDPAGVHTGPKSGQHVFHL